MLSKRSISSILTLYVFSLSAAILLIAGSISFFTHLKTKQQAIAQEQRFIAQTPAQTVRNFVADKVNILQASLWISDIHRLDKASQTRVLQTLAGMRPSFKQLVLLDTLDRQSTRISRRSQGADRPEDSPYYAAALTTIHGRSQYLSPVYVDTLTREPAILIALPITDVYGMTRGGLLAEVNLKFMWDLMRDLRVGERGTAYVVDKTGALIAYGDAARVLRGDNVRSLRAVADFLSARDSAAVQEPRIYRGIAGEDVVGSHTPLLTPDWAVVVEIPLQEAYADLIWEAIINTAVFAFLVVAAALVGTRLSRQVSRPIISLAETASRIAAGERTIQAEVAGPRETASLAEAFNSMTTQLRTSLVHLELQVEEVKHAEQALREKSAELDAYFTDALDLLCIADTNGCFRRLNKEWEHTLGYALHELEGRRFMDFVHPDDLELTLQSISTLKDNAPVRNFVNRYRARDGSYRWIEWRSIPVGTMIYAAARDITERKQVEEQIRRLNEELEERVLERTVQLEYANKELEAFSYSVSHDLRTPLRAIDGYTRILQEDFGTVLDAEGQRVCSVIRRETQRMGLLIDDLLAFSRLSRTSMSHSLIDMAQMATEVFHEVTTPEQRTRIDWLVQDLPRTLGDPSMIRQVWANLISNAVKFSSRIPRARIVISGRTEGTEHVYTVCDNGAGFDMEHGSKLFGVFQRLHSSKDFQGTGVGLAIVHRIVQRHGGRTWGEGTPDKGATFHFTIPQRSNHE
jgi:PAS domain S-box-containing protein